MSDLSTETPKRNWKRFFLVLLTINASAVIILLALIFWPVPQEDYPKQVNTTTQKSSEFTLRTTKENINELINEYLDEWLKNTDHNYNISLEDDVHLQGELPIFSTSIPLSAHLEPVVQDNGDVILKQESISVGILELPNKKIMEYIDKYLPTPDWVIVNPADEEIYVAVTDIDIKSNFEIAVQNMDLENNDLSIKINVPYKSLGITTPAE